jgi:hypothetical protein
MEKNCRLLYEAEFSDQARASHVIINEKVVVELLALLHLFVFSSRKSFSTSPSYFSRTICCIIFTFKDRLRKCSVISIPGAQRDGDTIQIINIKV